MEKKGYSDTVTILVVVALAILVLIILAIALTGGWSNFIDKINIFSKSNLATIAESCQISCSLEEGGKAGYCIDIKTVKKLEEAQFEEICINLGGTKNEETNLCEGANIKVGHSVDFKKKIAKTTCEVIANSGLINTCDAITC